MDGFACPTCGDTRNWGTITVDGKRLYACNGIETLPDGARRSCTYAYPATGHEPRRTREERAAALATLRASHGHMARGLLRLDPDDEASLREIEAGYGGMQSATVLLIDDAVNARHEREAPRG